MRELLTNEQRGLPPSSRGAEKESATPFKRPTKKSPDAPSAKAKNSMSVLRMDPISIRGVMRMDPIEITPSPQRSEELYQILDFLTGRAQMASHPTDPPADVPTNVTQRTRYHSPGFPSRQVPGYQETSIKRWIYDAARYNNVPV